MHQLEQLMAAGHCCSRDHELGTTAASGMHLAAGSDRVRCVFDSHRLAGIASAAMLCQQGERLPGQL